MTSGEAVGVNCPALKCITVDGQWAEVEQHDDAQHLAQIELFEGVDQG